MRKSNQNKIHKRNIIFNLRWKLPILTWKHSLSFKSKIPSLLKTSSSTTLLYITYNDVRGIGELYVPHIGTCTQLEGLSWAIVSRGPRHEENKIQTMGKGQYNTKFVNTMEQFSISNTSCERLGNRNRDLLNSRKRRYHWVKGPD